MGAATQTSFDANDWIEKAVAANMHPTVVIQRDGHKSLSMWCSDIDHEAAPHALIDENERAAVGKALINVGLVADVRACPD